MSSMTRTQKISALLAEHPDGMTSADMFRAGIGSQANKLGGLAMAMSVTGACHRIFVEPCCTYFLHEADRDRMAPILIAAHDARVAETRRLYTLRQAASRAAKRLAAGKPAPKPRAPRTIPQHSKSPAPKKAVEREVIGMDTAPRTVSLMPEDGRYFVDHRERVIGGFAAMGIGNYLEAA